MYIIFDKKIKKYGIYHKTYIVPKATFSHTGCNCRKLLWGICKCCKGGRGGTYHEEKLWEVFCGNLASKFWISPYLTEEFVFVSLLGLDVCSYLKFLTIRASGEGPKLHKKTFDNWRMWIISYQWNADLIFVKSISLVVILHMFHFSIKVE